MGRGGKWKSAEKEVLAKAWMAASSVRSCTEGSEQSQEMFWNKVLEEIKKREPTDISLVGEKYSNRGLTAIKSHWGDKIRGDVMKFNSALQLVYRSNPTGCTWQQMINMAVAIEIGRTKRMEYQYKDMDPYEWNNYASWLVLKGSRKFQPPSPPEQIDGAGNLIEEQPPLSEVATLNPEDNADDSLTESSAAGHSTRTPNNNNTAPAPGASVGRVPSTAASQKNRGGRGRTASKNQQAIDRHRRKKRRVMQELTDVQKHKMMNANRFMKFTMLKWKIEHETNEDKLDKYHSIMDSLLDEMFPEGELQPTQPLAQTMETTQQGTSSGIDLANNSGSDSSSSDED